VTATATAFVSTSGPSWRDRIAITLTIDIRLDGVEGHVVPSLAIATVICKIKITDWTHRSYTVLTYLLAFPMCWTIRIQYSLYSNGGDAARKGATLVPRGKRRWIGNIDLILCVLPYAWRRRARQPWTNIYARS
jgi:hypothetical protein